MKTLRKKPSVPRPALRSTPRTKITMAGLLDIMARLRGPAGCPWDREQTEASLKKYLVEEAHEVLEAIETGSPEGLKEELGDLLLQIVFLARISEEKGAFDFGDVVRSIAEKLVRRHPHVFRPVRIPGGTRPRDAQGVLKVWKAVKEMEGKNAGKESLLDGLPLSLPALERAQRISERASRAGFDWPNLEGVWAKVREEIAELEKAAASSDREAMQQELGDLLLSLVNWARFQGISAEETLREANRRFAGRFRQVEEELRRRGKTPEESILEEMDAIWNEVKRRREKRERQ